MDASSWLRRSVSRLKKTTLTSTTTTTAAESSRNKEEDEQLYGVTEQLIEFIKSFSVQTFTNFSLIDEEGSNDGDGGNSGNISKDLSDWQEKHAMLVLSRIKELAQLRFHLCPRHLKEREFWRIYFTLVRSYVIEYELRAVRLAKLKQMTTESNMVSNSSAYEVEMSKAKFPMSSEPEISMEQK